MTMAVAAASRRDRNMRDKRDRIFRAAAELFAERGFAAVTTQEAANAACLSEVSIAVMSMTLGPALDCTSEWRPRFRPKTAKRKGFLTTSAPPQRRSLRMRPSWQPSR